MAFKVIKAKSNLISINAYLTFSVMIQDLENIFGKLNKVDKSNAFLYNPKFGIAIANLKEIFDMFLTRFISAIVLLDFIDWYKISNLWQTFNEQLWFKMANATSYFLFSQYVSHCC